MFLYEMINFWQKAYIQWPVIQGYGSLLCAGDSACSYVNFPDNPKSSEPLSVTCDSNMECAYSTIRCPNEASCTLNCMVPNSCKGVCDIDCIFIKLPHVICIYRQDYGVNPVKNAQ